MKIMNHRTIFGEDLFITIAGSVVGIFFVAVVVAELHIFFIVNIVSLLFLLFPFAIACFLFIQKKISIKLNNWETIAILISLIFCTINSIFFHESFTGGRDDGVYANSALYLAEHNSLSIHETVAVSFPGFVNTSHGIISQFYIGYPIWIAMILRFFGPESVNFVNFPLLFIGLLSIYYLCKHIESSQSGIVTIVLLSLSYPFLWFTRTTFSENLAFMLTWFSLLCLVKGFQTKHIAYLFLSLITGNILLTVRGESIPFTILLDIIVLLVGFKSNKSFSLVLLFFGVISLLPVTYYYIFLDPRYLEIFRSMIGNGINAIVNKLHPITQNARKITLDKNIVQYHQPLFVFLLLQLYNFYFFILMIPIAIIKSFKSYGKEQKLYFWVLLFLLIINFYFLSNPAINFDQPWFLRRFMPVILPLGYMSFSFVLISLQRNIQVITTSILLVYSFFIAGPTLTFKEYEGTLAQVKTYFNTIITKKDLLLVDYDNTGHFKLAEPLFFLMDYNAIAVQQSSLQELFGQKGINDNDLYEGQTFQLHPNELCQYKKIFVLTTSYRPNILTGIIKNENVSTIKNYLLTYNELVKTCELFRIANKTTFEQMANVKFTDASDFCTDIPNTISTQKIPLQLEEIKPSFFSQLKNMYCAKKA